MTFDPAGSLTEGTDYVATEGIGATDASGNALSAGQTWSFRTLTNVASTPSGTGIETGSPRSGSHSQLGADDNAYFEVNSTSSGTRTAAWFGSFQNVANELAGLKVTYMGQNSKACSQTVSIWSYAAGAWVQLDSRTVGTSEVPVEGTPTGNLADYVSGTAGDGELRVRVRCTRGGGATFFSSGDLMRISYTEA